MKLKTTLFLLLLLTTFFANAQYYLSGQDPASIRWQQMQTTYFRLIFPEGQFEQARKLAYLTAHSYPMINEGLKAKKIKSDLILHTSSSISNATVAWAPRRLDYFHTPSQDGYSQEWYRQLSTHELRHIAQISSLNSGFGKGLSLLFGQQATAALLGVFIPNWFLEGDAVVTETVHSFSGRGRQSLFEAGLRAQLLEMGTFSYDKAYFGSYRHHVPDIYELGYYYVGYQRHLHGESLWQEMLNTTARQAYRLNPFSYALKQTTGKNKNQLFNETMAALTNIWETQDQQTVLTPITELSPPKKIFTSYRFPQTLSDGSLLAIRTAKNDITRIVRINDSSETIVFTPGSMFIQSLSATDSLVVWNEYQADPRWSNRSYSVIKLGVLKTGIIRQISFQSNLFAPDITSDNQKIVAAETNNNGQHALVVMDASSGEIVQRLLNDSLFFQTPKWFDDKLHIAATLVGPKGKALARIHSLTGEIELLLPYTYDDFALSNVFGDKLLLHGSWSGISNIYLYETASREITQLNSSRFGAAYASISGSQEIVFSDYHANGWKLGKMRLSDALHQNADAVVNKAFPLADLLSHETSFNIDELEIPDTTFLVKPYRKFNNLFHFHSWSPLFINADNQTFGPGVSIFSQNTLSTLVTELGFSYDINQQTGKTMANISYYGWYPVIRAGISSGLRRDETTIEDQLYKLKWWETDWSVNLSIPLNFTRSKWIRGFRPAVGFRQIHRKMDETIGLDFKYDFASSLSYDLFGYQYLRSSSRDLIPRFGLALQTVLRHSPFDAEPSLQFYAGATAFLPGVAAHHGLKLFGAMQREERGYFSYGSLIASPRGYTNIFFRDGFTLKADYVFPLAYPELNWPMVAYFKRIRGNLFYDLIAGYNSANEWRSFESVGMEVQTDWHFFNFPAPVNLGIRLSYRLLDQQFSPEFLFGINFDAIQ